MPLFPSPLELPTEVIAIVPELEFALTKFSTVSEVLATSTACPTNKPLTLGLYFKVEVFLTIPLSSVVPSLAASITG